MNDLDNKILAAIQEHNNSTPESEEQANVLQLIGRSFKGNFRITAFFVIFLQVIFAALSIWCVIELLNHDDIGLKINWLAGALGAFIVFTALRLWFFMELNRLSVLREIKRVELQLATLAQVNLK